MGRFNEDSELEAVIRILKKKNINLYDVADKLEMTRTDINNIRRSIKSSKTDKLTEKIKQAYPSINFEDKPEQSDFNNDQYREKYIKSLEDEVQRQKIQIDYLLKKLLGEN